ncbi:MFS transporter [Olivibacter ginsenosidimutans]|uniref:MFS transporter n=1 Tax=Olivibacter ginsenosidimutans TaxID=1176537 RepID=A0ABP9AZC6_9SPHI
MYKEGLFHSWIPKPVQITLMFVLALPLLTVSGIYTANISDMYSGLGTLAETLTFANYASTVGMMVGIGVVLKIKPYFKSKVILLITFIGLGLLSLIIGYTEIPEVIMLCSLLLGFIKIFGMIELVSPIMFIISPKGDRGAFYAVFYPLILSAGQFVGYLTATTSYKLNWHVVYLIAAMILFACALVCTVFMHNKWKARWTPIQKIDWIGVGLFTVASLLLNYLLVYTKQQGWFYASMNLKAALAGFVVVVALFIRRQLTVDIPFIPLSVFGKRNVVTAIILFSLMGMYLATSTLQSAFTSILKYDTPTNALLNLAMVPGIILGGCVASRWFKYEWSTRSILLIAYGCFLLYTVSLYFLVSPVIEIAYLLLPIFLKGLGVALVYIGGGFYFANSLQPMQLMGAYPIVIGIRSFIGTAFFSALFSWGLYQLQWDGITALATEMDAMDPWVQASGGAQLYPSVQTQATLTAIKRLFGYIALASTLVLIYIALHPFYRLQHRKLILARKRFKGEPIAGYRTDSFDDKDIAATAVSVST